MLTLHAYTARELLKTFAMTLTALTVLLVMGGGVANLFRGETAGARDMIRVFLFFTPVAVTLVLPVAALFSATITYGRMAADNEILACRAAGVNIHKLLLSAFLLGLLVTVVTAFSWNYLLPNLTGQIEEMTRRDLPVIVRDEFRKAKPLSYGKYHIMADRCDTVPPEQIPADLRDHQVYLHLTGVSFIEEEDQSAARYGSADETIICFDRSAKSPRITADLQGVRSFDTSRRQYYELKHQILGPFEFPMGVRQRPKFETLSGLLHYRRRPQDIPEVDARLLALRPEMMACFLAADVEEQLTNGRSYALQGPNVQYELQCDSFLVDEWDGRPCLKGNLRAVETRAGEQRVYTAEVAYIEVHSSLDPLNPSIEVQLIGDVECQRLPAQPGDRTVRKPRETLGPVPYLSQERLATQINRFDPLTLLDENRPLPLFKRQVKGREKLIERLRKFSAEIVGEIHFRASYSLSAVAVVLLGAILGIVVRGGQVLTAFGISFIPLLIVWVATAVGRNLVDRPGYALASVLVMWGATVLMYAAAAFVATRVLQR
jgi:lipopolysaccharide export LptBFGC system permease protein LptF